jgi:hypothetical protein
MVYFKNLKDSEAKGFINFDIATTEIKVTDARHFSLKVVGNERVFELKAKTEKEG